jgi:taurine dioxygenase
MENGRTAVPGLPEVYLVSNIKDADGKEIGSLGAGEAVWHTDMSYLAAPPDISMLHAIEVPPAGGDTWLCGMNAAYNALPEDLKRRVRGLRIKHDGTYNSGGYVRQGVTPTDDPRKSPGTYHPVVIAHPNTGQPLLYLGRRRMAHIEGLDLAESEALLDELWSYATREENAYRHNWRIGDVLMWDNRATMHRRDPFDAASRRLMRRTQVKGAVMPAPYAG